MGDALIQRLAVFMSQTGLVKDAYRSDRVPALLALFDEATRLSGRNGRRLGKGENPEDVAEDVSEYDDLFTVDASTPRILVVMWMLRILHLLNVRAMQSPSLEIPPTCRKLLLRTRLVNSRMCRCARLCAT